MSKKKNGLGFLEVNMRLQGVKLYDPEDFLETCKPKSFYTFDVSGPRESIMRALQPIGCIFSRKITKNDSVLSLLEGEHYTIVKSTPEEGYQIRNWVFGNDEDYDGIIELLKDGWMVGTKTKKDAFMVIFTKDDVEELFLKVDRETGYMDLVRLWFYSSVNEFVNYGQSTPIAYDAFFNVNIPVIGINNKRIDPVDFFNEVMDSHLRFIFESIRDIVRAHPYALYAVEERAGGITLIRYEDVRIMLFERERIQKLDEVDSSE